MEDLLTLDPPAAAGRVALTVEGPLPVPAWRRILGRVVGKLPGPTLIVIGGVHGNEPSGVRGLERVLLDLVQPPGSELESSSIRGEFVALAGNLQALEKGMRFIERDLNRSWGTPRVEALATQPVESLSSPEDREQWAVLTEIQAAIDRARGPVVIVDLHSTSAGGAPFVVLNDSLPNRKLAAVMPVPIVLGLEEELAGTLLSYFAEKGFATLAFESGQHDSPRSVKHAEAAIWKMLEAAELLIPGEVEPPEEPARLLREVGAGLPTLAEVRYRHEIKPEDGFRMNPGYSNFQPVSEGEILARDIRGPVRSPQTGLILMPLYQKLGEDGFFLVRGFSPFWMKVSAWLQASGADRKAHWLPGVSRLPGDQDALLVDQTVARFFPREVFHLLGYKRAGTEGGRLLMRRGPTR